MSFILPRVTVERQESPELMVHPVRLEHQGSKDHPDQWVSRGRRDGPGSRARRDCPAGRETRGLLERRGSLDLLDHQGCR